jgi:hypothetical protein
MNGLFDLKDNQVVIKPESLLIYPFSELWKRDKSKTKESATKDIKYVWFYCDFDSPYFNYEDDERALLIKEQVLEDTKYKTDELVNKSIERYKELHLTPSMRMLDAAYTAIFKMDKYFKDIDFDNDDIDKVQKAIIAMPKMIQSINESKELCKKEQAATERVKGNAEINMFEDR